jgi:hypothetical protein
MSKTTINKKIIKAPEYLSAIEYALYQKKIFLGGSIEQNSAPLWQPMMEEALGANTLIMNPRRDDWDSSWEQKKENQKFNDQVTWELFHLEKADWIVMYFAPGTISPISLLEFGLHAKSGKLLVCCPEGFQRKGNVDIVCERYKIQQFSSLYEIISFINDSNR